MLTIPNRFHNIRSTPTLSQKYTYISHLNRLNNKKTSPSLSSLLCFSLLVTRALINQPFSWESSANTKSHSWSISTYSVWSLTPMADHTTRCSLFPFQRPFFQADLGQPVPECLHSALYWSDWGGGDNCSYMMCKAPVKSSSPTNQHQVYTHETAVNRHYMRLELRR